MNRKSLKTEFQCEDCGKGFQTDATIKEHEGNIDCSQEGSQGRWKSEAIDAETKKEISIAEDLTSLMSTGEYDQARKNGQAQEQIDRDSLEDIALEENIFRVNKKKKFALPEFRSKTRRAGRSKREKKKLVMEKRRHKNATARSKKRTEKSRPRKTGTAARAKSTGSAT
jgi:hypothetical protein